MELIFLDCHEAQNTLRNFRLEMDFSMCKTLEMEMDCSKHRTLQLEWVEMDFSEHRTVQLEWVKMDFSMGVQIISLEWVKATVLEIMVTLMMTQM